MGNFHSNARGGFRGGRGGGRDGGFRGRRDDGFNRDRGSRGRNEMHDVTCAKCGKRCQVPFKPNGSKPIFCDECFNKEGSNSGSRNQVQSQDSSEQFRQINAKLDKILLVLQSLELEIEEDLEDSDLDEEDIEEDL